MKNMFKNINYESSEKVLRELKGLASKKLSKAKSMPKELYTSNEILELEKKHIFSKEWVCAGREKEIPNSGDYFTFQIDKQPIVILRDENNNVKALSNVCLHRMMKIVEGKGNKKRFTCPYHAWTYSLDGQLVMAKYMDKTDCFNKDDMKLPQIKCEVFLGWIYVSLNNNIQSVSSKLKELKEIASPYAMEKYIDIISEDLTWDTNWKILTENFMEGYHLPVAHLGTVGPLINLLDTEFDKRGAFESFTYQKFTKNPDSLVGTAHKNNKILKGKWRHTSILPTIFPSHMYSLAPDHLWYLSLQPNGTGRVNIKFGAAIAPEVIEDQKDPETFLKETKKFLYEVQNEDRYVVEGIYKGVCSPLGQPGPLSWLERENHEFTQYISRKLTKTI